MSQRKITAFLSKSPSTKGPLKEMVNNEPPCKRKADFESEDEPAGPVSKAPKNEDEVDTVEKVTTTLPGGIGSSFEKENGPNKLSDENNPLRTHQSTLNFKNVNVQEEIAAMAARLPVIDPKMGQSWFQALKSEFKKPYFEKLNNFVIEERKRAEIYPPPEKVWSWTKECSLDNIKVVILGQDPYHNPGQAHGLCFSVMPPVPPPPSLINMYKELATDIEGFTPPKHGCLLGWARQGVLLLNACLTVRKNLPNSHKDQGWENLTTAVIKYLNEHRTGIVFLLWGAYAQKKADFVDKKKHHVLKTVHPSPLSASRGWFGSKHFSKCNDYLIRVDKRPIDWTRLPEK